MSKLFKVEMARIIVKALMNYGDQMPSADHLEVKRICKKNKKYIEPMFQKALKVLIENEAKINA